MASRLRRPCSFASTATASPPFGNTRNRFCSAVPPGMVTFIAEAKSNLSPSIRLMNALDFKVFLERDEDYDGYVVVCPSLQGCYSQGKTVEEALANIREAIELCLEDMESRGESIPNPSNILIGSVLVTR
ncbi:MAG: type II toxin-antitoxin system HicB family antitoxin [Candidatus Acidiferrum sp.]